jgi:hypothetical protein
MPAEKSWQTVRSRCLICDGVIEPKPVKWPCKAMTNCDHCGTTVVLETEEISTTVCNDDN